MAHWVWEKSTNDSKTIPDHIDFIIRCYTVIHTYIYIYIYTYKTIRIYVYIYRQTYELDLMCMCICIYIYTYRFETSMRSNVSIFRSYPIINPTISLYLLTNSTIFRYEQFPFFPHLLCRGLAGMVSKRAALNRASCLCEDGVALDARDDGDARRVNG